MSINDELNDVTIIVTQVLYNDDNKPYAITHIRRGDLVGNIDTFLQHVRNTDQIVEFHNPYDKETV